MSGHSKWSKIKRQKEVNDKAKGAVFAKLSRSITLAVIEGGGVPQPENNIRLRLAVEKARSLNMPKENITRAIEKGVGPNKQALKEVVYEAFGPAGGAFLIVATTDNSNRTYAEVRTMLERNGGKLANQGAVSYLFQKCGVASFDLLQNSESDIFVFAEKIGAHDFEQDEKNITLYFPFENLGKTHEYRGELVPLMTEVEYRPLTTISIDESHIQSMVHLIEVLEELEDVHNVYTNI